MRLKNSFVGLAMLTGALMASGAALADPTATIDGVTIPVGIIPGGFYIDSELSAETLVTSPGQSFAGVFEVQSISASGSFGDTYQYSQNGVYLYGEFTGFTVDTVVAPTATSAGTITLTGGQLDYYVTTNPNQFTVSSGTSTDLTDDGAGQPGTSLWLSATPECVQAGSGSACDTLTLTIPENNGLDSFIKASASTLLDVTGGDAAYNFNTNTFLNTYTGQLADINYTGSASTSSGNADFQVVGNNEMDANTVPEPLTISLFGAGLVGAAALRRRKSKKA